MLSYMITSLQMYKIFFVITNDNKKSGRISTIYSCGKENKRM